MSEPFDRLAYPIGNRLVSMTELLRIFADPEHEREAHSRYSDLHLKIGEPARYRFDGDLQVIPGAEPVTEEMLRALIEPTLSPEQREVLHAGRDDVDVGFQLPATGQCFRLNIFHDRDGLAATIRALPRKVLDVRDVGFHEDQVWQNICSLSQGLVLLSGQTGSGKSTSIASLIQKINEQRAVRIISLEDPIEYVFSSGHALISQRELGTHISSFSEGLRSALREDPDIIYVGEMRDTETIALALTAAETGHLVFSTLHSRDATSTLTRILDSFPADRQKAVATQLSLSLAYVINQKLVTRRDGGRIVAMEVLHNNTAAANLLRTGTLPQLYGMIESSTRDTMITLERHLGIHYKAGAISFDEAEASANVPEALRRHIG